ncbi:phospholipase A2 homolog 3-like [Ananas comosus]|uniref:phospholipase A2 n=1 Tax=Ananas comosus TaxID=4615 RepID=A0A6P5F2E8_ANACO|nr:phospholipase A2 homolog 3-like [Ananas comosus]
MGCGRNLGKQKPLLTAITLLINYSLHSKRACSRTCESAHCKLPPFLRYGKYCGALYGGCPGEKPCDALDACCMAHDACIQAKGDYLSTECNEKFLSCMVQVRKEGGKTFEGNKCEVDEVVSILSPVIEAAILAGKALHKP